MLIPCARVGPAPRAILGCNNNKVPFNTQTRQRRIDLDHIETKRYSTLSCRMSALFIQVSALRNPATMPSPERLPTGDTMKTRIAVIAVCAGTFAFAQANPVQAAHAGATESKSAVSIVVGGSAPASRLSQNSKNNMTQAKARLIGGDYGGTSSDLPKTGAKTRNQGILTGTGTKSANTKDGIQQGRSRTNGFNSLPGIGFGR